MTDARQLLLDENMDIDAKATARRVRNFLDHNFDHYLSYAGLNPVDLSVIDDSHLSSPKMDASGVSAHGGINHTESSFNRVIEAEHACRAIYHTIINCKNAPRTPYRTILEENYLRYTPDIRIQTMLGYSPSRYDVLKRQALCEFADRWEHWKDIYHVEYLEDFHVRKNEKGDETGKDGTSKG